MDSYSVYLKIEVYGTRNMTWPTSGGLTGLILLQPLDLLYVPSAQLTSNYQRQ